MQYKRDLSSAIDFLMSVKFSLFYIFWHRSFTSKILRNHFHLFLNFKFQALNILKEIPEETKKRLSAKGFFAQNGYVLQYLPVPPNCLLVPEISDGKSVMSSVSYALDHIALFLSLLPVYITYFGWFFICLHRMFLYLCSKEFLARLNSSSVPDLVLLILNLMKLNAMTCS